MNFDNVSYWDGDHASGPPKIRIRLHEQKAYFYKGDQLVGVSVLSTGREGFGTPPGSFKIQQKDKDHVSSRYGDYVDSSGGVLMKDIDRQKDKMPRGAKYDGAKMPYFMRLHGGVGMHEGFLPGYPASHGCIRMPGFMAETFFRNVEVGTPVTIEP
jgi:lipoprotein-anchoring transpeptidase ErfK/SrfK